jgi:DNA-binding GntR family transcriptional regulator
MQINKTDLVDQVYDAIRKKILSGVLNPESPLRQEELAEQLGVSRQPISHALVLLEREGLISDYGRKGKMVAPIVPEQLRDLYQVRGAIDGLAAYLCAMHVNNELKELLRSLIEQGETASQTGSIQSLAFADIAFHRALYERSGNPEITRLADQSWSHMVRSMHQVLENQTIRTGIWDDHRAIADAIIAGDPELARERAANHASSAGQMTYQRLTDS